MKKRDADSILHSAYVHLTRHPMDAGDRAAFALLKSMVSQTVQEPRPAVKRQVRRQAGKYLITAL